MPTPWILLDFTDQNSVFIVADYGETMAPAKTAALTFRIEPDGEEALRGCTPCPLPRRRENRRNRTPLPHEPRRGQG